MSEVDFFTYIHAYQVPEGRKTALMKKITKHFGLTKADVEALDGFTRRMTELCELNEEIKSFMFLDAEQTYI